MPAPVAGAVKQERSRVLRELSDRQRREFLRSHLARTRTVLWEGRRLGRDGLDWYFGYTPNYIKVGMAARDDLSYRITPALLKVLDASGEFVLGEPAASPTAAPAAHRPDCQPACDVQP